ncbi:hypothetical protein GARC_2019 [Paraglaciecola arctica BSs20135]|uniref:Uncharacterized protein n=2 Tax=Paraglaciecola TaxID=1621534 RepID=K6Y4V1_9ALTE|nr:hypothetical protein GARC_2019 [Paraglaciecola arctica BSs20135]
MKTFELPKSISSLANELQIIQMVWQGVPVQIPKFAVYAIIEKPIFDQIVFRNSRQIGLLHFGRYKIPVLDPFRGDIDFHPNFALIISHSRGNCFGLYGYPADHIESDMQLSSSHGSVFRIVKDYV